VGFLVADEPAWQQFDGYYEQNGPKPHRNEPCRNVLLLLLPAVADAVVRFERHTMLSNS